MVACFSRNAGVHCHGVSVVQHAATLVEVSALRQTRFTDMPWDETDGSFSLELAKALPLLASFMTSMASDLDVINVADTAARATGQASRHALVESYVAKLWIPKPPPPHLSNTPKRRIGARKRIS